MIRTALFWLLDTICGQKKVYERREGNYSYITLKHRRDAERDNLKEEGDRKEEDDWNFRYTP